MVLEEEGVGATLDEAFLMEEFFSLVRLPPSTMLCGPIEVPILRELAGEDE